MIIDAHQHFWKYNAQKHAWIGDDMAVLKQDFLPGDLQQVYQENDIDGCVAVQADQSEEETVFLLQLAEEHAFIRGVVGWVDLTAPGIEARLQHFSRFEKLKGFRHIVQDEPDVNFMLRSDFQRGLSLLPKYGFTYDVLIYPRQLEAALKTIERFPEHRFVIDHLAKPFIRDGKISGWAELIKEIARHEQVYCKVSGLVTEADWTNWSYDDFTPYLDLVVEAFGSRRLMFGSDWPVCLLAGTYPEIKGLIENYFSSFSELEKGAIWRGNAEAFYGL